MDYNRRYHCLLCMSYYKNMKCPAVDRYAPRHIIKLDGDDLIIMDGGKCWPRATCPTPPPRTGTGRARATSLPDPAPPHSILLNGFILFYFFHDIPSFLSYNVIYSLLLNPSPGISKFMLLILNLFWIEKICICVEKYYILILVPFILIPLVMKIRNVTPWSIKRPYP